MANPAAIAEDVPPTNHSRANRRVVDAVTVGILVVVVVVGVEVEGGANAVAFFVKVSLRTNAVRTCPMVFEYLMVDVVVQWSMWRTMWNANRGPFCNADVSKEVQDPWDAKMSGLIRRVSLNVSQGFICELSSSCRARTPWRTYLSDVHVREC